jgi:hypothetical protein
MSNKDKAHRILWIEGIGFGVIILLSWLDELIALPRLILGGGAHPNWRESALESLLTFIVWLAVFVTTRRILRRFHYLEEMLQMCAWCRKLNHGGEWTSLEDYCSRELGVDISHGICPSCGRTLLQEHESKLA